MPIDQQRISNVSRNDTFLVDINISDIVNDMNSASLTSVGRLDDPNVLFLLLTMHDSLVMFKPLIELIR